MGLSKRERIIILMTIVAVGGLIGDKFVITPVWSGMGELQGQRRELATKVAKAKTLLKQQEVEKGKHKVFFEEGLKTATEAESSVFKAIDQWARDAGLDISSITPSPLAGDKGLGEIVFVIAGKGSLDAITWFLHRAERAELPPVKVKYMQLGSTSESGDNMTMEMRLSTLYLAGDEKSSSKQRQPKQRGTTNEEFLQ
jgi:hypothetical protein